MTVNGHGAVAAVYPGSFDPLTMGHYDVIARAARIFDSLVVAVVVNPQKREPLFSIEERSQMIVEACSELPNVAVETFRGLLADYVRGRQADVIVKGLRVVSDFEAEMSLAHMNRALSGIDTCFLPSDARYGFVSSTLVKEVYTLGGDVREYVPPAVWRVMDARRDPLRRQQPR